MSVLLLIFGLISFVGLVVVHEWGHFLAARRSGVEVEEFGVGFPPKAKTIAIKNGTEYTINWLPLGGFVKLKGENDYDDRKGSFGAAKLSDKVKIMVAGVIMNLITAFILLTFLSLIGMPQIIKNQFFVKNDSSISAQRLYVGYVGKDSPAEIAGLQVRDQLVSISTDFGEIINLKSAEELPGITNRLNGQQVQITYSRGGEQKTSDIKLLTTQEVEASKGDDQPKGYLGIVPAEFTQRRSTWSAPVVAGVFVKDFTILTLKAIGSALKGLFSTTAGIFTGNNEARKKGQAEASSQVGGPIAVYFTLKDASALGISFILMIIAVISLSLAIMNILPIPALDGGRLFITLLFKVLKKPLKPEIEDKIHGIGMLVLLSLFVLITFVDIKRFF